jgi:translation elongation factor EF-Tu-like GTPase
MAWALRRGDGVVLGFDPTVESWESLRRRAFLVRHGGPSGRTEHPSVVVLIDLLAYAGEPDVVETRVRATLCEGGLPGDDLPLGVVTAPQDAHPTARFLAEALAEALPPRPVEDPRPLRLALTGERRLASGAVVGRGVVLQGTLQAQPLELVGRSVRPVKLKEVLSPVVPVVAPRETEVRLKNTRGASLPGSVLAAAGTLRAWSRARCAIEWLDAVPGPRDPNVEAYLPAGTQPATLLSPEESAQSEANLAFAQAQPLEVGDRFLVYTRGGVLGSARVEALLERTEPPRRKGGFWWDD